MLTLHRDILEVFKRCDGILNIYIEDSDPPLHYTLAKVCWKWHETIHHCSSLWRKFGIDFNDGAMAGSKNVQIHTRRLDKCLKSSGALGLILELRYDSRQYLDTPPFLEIAAGMLGKHSDRWVKLNFRPCAPAFLSAFGTKALKGIPCLESLTLELVQREDQLGNCPPWCDAAKLETISLKLAACGDTFQPHLKHVIPWWQITKLIIDRCFIHHRELRQLLDRTPALRNLTMVSGAVEGVTRKITPVYLQYLQTLIYKPPMARDYSSASTYSGLQQMFDLLDCPDLRALLIEPWPLLRSGILAQDVLEFVRRTGCKLETLSLLMANMDDVKTLILEIPSLKCFDMANPIAISDAWERLADILIPTFTLDGMYIPAPNLQVLSFRVMVAGGISKKEELKHKEGVERLVEILEYRVKGSPFLPVYNFRPIQFVTFNERRVKINGHHLPKCRPEIYEPLLNFARKHRVKTQVDVWTEGRIEVYQGEGFVSGSIKTDDYKFDGHLEHYNCNID